MSDEDRVSTVSSPKTETKTETGGFQDQDRDQDSEVPRPRPRPRLSGSKTETETKTCKNGSRDILRPRLKSRELQVWISGTKSLWIYWRWTAHPPLFSGSQRSVKWHFEITRAIQRWVYTLWRETLRTLLLYMYVEAGSTGNRTCLTPRTSLHTHVAVQDTALPAIRCCTCVAGSSRL